MKKSEELYAEAKALDEKSMSLKKQASEARQHELREMPKAERLVYAARDRCPCGAGLAYDPCYEDKSSPSVGPLSGYWDCSEILLGTAKTDVKHTDKLPFAFYEIKSEGPGTAMSSPPTSAETDSPISRSHSRPKRFSAMATSS